MGGSGGHTAEGSRKINNEKDNTHTKTRSKTSQLMKPACWAAPDANSALSSAKEMVTWWERSLRIEKVDMATHAKEISQASRPRRRRYSAVRTRLERVKKEVGAGAQAILARRLQRPGASAGPQSAGSATATSVRPACRHGPRTNRALLSQRTWAQTAPTAPEGGPACGVTGSVRRH